MSQTELLSTNTEDYNEVSDRLRRKHIATLEVLQQVVDENEILRHTGGGVSRSALEAARRQSVDLETQLSTTFGEVEKLKKDKNDLEIELHTTTSRLKTEKLKRLQVEGEIEKWKNTYQTRQQEIDYLHESVQKLTPEAAALDDCQKKLSRLQIEFTDLQGKNEELETTVFTLTKKLDEANADKKDLDLQNANKDIQIYKMNKEHDEILFKLRQNVDELLSKVDVENSKRVDTERVLGKSQKLCEEKDSEIAALTEEIKHLRATEALLVREVKTLRDEIATIPEPQVEPEDKGKRFRDFIRLKRENQRLLLQLQEIRQSNPGLAQHSLSSSSSVISSGSRIVSSSSSNLSRRQSLPASTIVFGPMGTTMLKKQNSLAGTGNNGLS